MKYEIFERLKELDLKIIESLKNDEEDLELIDKRGEIIQEIIAMNLEKEKFEKLYIEYNLNNIDIKLESILKEKLEKAKEDIKKASHGRMAISAYNNTSNINLNFYSRKI